MTRTRRIEGIGKTYSTKLHNFGIDTSEQLLRQCGTRTARMHLAKTTHISPKRILGWVNRADLTRVNGIGEEYADLLECAGVDSTLELAKRDPHRLYETLTRTNHTKHLVRRLPTETQVTKWIMMAKKLPRMVRH